MPLLLKIGVWEPGKADASRFDRFSNLDEFAEALTKLNPGDEVELYFLSDSPIDLTKPHEGRTIPELYIVAKSDKPTVDKELFETVCSIIETHKWLTPEQIAIIDENVLRIVESHNRV